MRAARLASWRRFHPDNFSFRALAPALANFFMRRRVNLMVKTSCAPMASMLALAARFSPFVCFKVAGSSTITHFTPSVVLRAWNENGPRFLAGLAASNFDV